MSRKRQTTSDRNKQRRIDYAIKKDKKNRLALAEQKFKQMKKRSDKGKADLARKVREKAIKRCRDVLNSQDRLSDEDKNAAIIGFEEECQKLRHSHCMLCRMVRINMHVSKHGKSQGRCETCKTKRATYFTDQNALPIWWKNGKPMYGLPDELVGLSHAEKMLIQRISPFVPLHHIKNGTFGLSGHVCSFEQDIDKFYRCLPRSKNDTGVVKVLQYVRAEIGITNKSTIRKAFSVRKSKVLGALRWLKQNNDLYYDIEIDESALTWIEGETGVLDGTTVILDDMETSADATNETSDMGPAQEQCVDPGKKGDNIHAFGFTDESIKPFLSDKNKRINTTLQTAVKTSAKRDEFTVDWPDVGIVPVNELGDKKIFALAFPWLFPGGVGDVKDYPGDLVQWGKNMLYYEDSRFARDKIFCFFAMNFIMRRRNNSSGKFFVENFNKENSDTLGALQESIEEGDTSFVNSLTYYNKRIKGSNPYWMGKRAEVYTWINHHVQEGNGAPTMFITLSCAEYFWTDVIKLLEERLLISGLDASEIYAGSPQLVQIANDHSVVIQEYFQARVELWLKSVGREIFDIAHHWLRYEFAPGRGQIHAHLLAIPRTQEIFHACHEIYRGEDGDANRAKLLSAWASQQFGLTASVDSGFEELEINNHNTPVQIRFTDVAEKEETRARDAQRLMKAVQCHQCSEFCMKTDEKKSSKRRCKVGCGFEEKQGKADTPGFELSGEPTIKFDHKRTQKLYMPRNHPRLNQTSVHLLQSWRGNCDLQLLVYNCDPKQPNLAEIARVTDYVVGYTCKGNCTFKEEKEQSKNMILTAEALTGDNQDVKRIVKQCMNITGSKRLISKQEACVLLGDLPLTTCSETIENVSISRSKMIRESEGETQNQKFIELYANRSADFEKVSLYEYFLIYKNKHIENEGTKRKFVIPNFVGINGSPTYPVTESYARHSLIVFRPWRVYPESCDWTSEFHLFIHSRLAIPACKMGYERVKQRYIDDMTFYEPTSMQPNGGGPIAAEDREILDLVGLKNTPYREFDEYLLKSMDKGENYPWDAPPQARKLDPGDANVHPSEWLNREVKKHRSNDGSSEKPQKLNIPRTDKGQKYTLDSLFPDQRAIAVKIINKVKEWLECDDLSTFQPLHMTISGQGGSGKSVIINTVVTALRELFQTNDVVRVAAPTGTAAFNVNGETLHYLSMQNANVSDYKQFGMSDPKRKLMIQRFKHLLVLIIDERSLISSKDLGMVERSIAETIFHGGHMADELFGGLPVVVLVGDDYQLPSIQEGALHCFTSRKGGKLMARGRMAFKVCGKVVAELTSSKRVKQSQAKNKRLIERLRIGTDMLEYDVEKLLSLHLDKVRKTHGSKYVDELKREAMYLFYRNEPHIRHNIQQMSLNVTAENPAAMLYPQTTGKKGKAISSHYDGNPLETTFINRGCKVALDRRNFCPNWGLYNGACGTVEEIVYASGESPNLGNLPSYVVVTFPLYSGPVWDQENPKSVPIPVVKDMCARMCCSRIFLPLTLAYARTIHKFQGLSAGPVDEGKLPNMHKTIICDPDQRTFEGTNVGLLYTAVSRATTLGEPDGTGSALYFAGEHFKEGRIRQLTKKSNSMDDYQLVTKRDRWVAYLKKHTTHHTIKKSEYQKLTKWIKNTSISKEQLFMRVTSYTQACCGRKRKFKML